MIRLEVGPLACEIEPGLGGCIAALWLGDLPVLRSTPAARLGRAVLQPGESLSARMAIEVEAVA